MSFAKKPAVTEVITFSQYLAVCIVPFYLNTPSYPTPLTYVKANLE